MTIPESPRISIRKDKIKLEELQITPDFFSSHFHTSFNLNFTLSDYFFNNRSIATFATFATFSLVPTKLRIASRLAAYQSTDCIHMYNTPINYGYRNLSAYIDESNGRVFSAQKGARILSRFSVISERGDIGIDCNSKGNV